MEGALCLMHVRIEFKLKQKVGSVGIWGLWVLLVHMLHLQSTLSPATPLPVRYSSTVPVPSSASVQDTALAEALGLVLPIHG